MFTVPSYKFKRYLDKKNRKMSNFIDNRLEHFNYRTEREWRKILEDIGFRNIEIKEYMDKRAFKLWLKLLKIVTYRIGNTELWSIFKSMGKIPYLKSVSKFTLKSIIKPYLNQIYSDNGYFYFIKAVK
jgi:hypothetical protein